MLSKNEIDAATTALNSGIRTDGRGFLDPRKLVLKELTTPGVANIQLGNTSVTAVTTARLITPSANSPKKGIHNIYIFSDNPTKKSKSDAFQTYFKMIWSSCRIIEDESLCVKVGEKVWMLVTRIIIHDDDGGLLEASFAAVIASLGSLRFPSFDANTGILFSPIHHRVHRIAFAVRALIVTIGYIGDKILVDPLKIENEITPRFARFVIDEWGTQIYMDSHRPGDIDGAFEQAKIIAKNWFSSLTKEIEKFNPQLYSVGSPADFADYIPKQFVPPQSSLQNINYEPIEVWYGETKCKITLDMDVNIEEQIEAKDTTQNADSDWLFSSVI